MIEYLIALFVIVTVTEKYTPAIVAVKIFKFTPHDFCYVLLTYLVVKNTQNIAR